MLQVLSVALLLLSVMVARAATTTSTNSKPGVNLSSSSKPAQPAAAHTAAASTPAAGASSSSSSTTTSAAAVAASAAGTGCVSVDWASRCFSQLLPVRPPPVMHDPGLLSNAAEEQQQGSVVVADAYTSLKQNYEGLVLFLTLVGLAMWTCSAGGWCAWLVWSVGR